MAVRKSSSGGAAAPHKRKLTIIAEDPDVKVGARILTTEVEIPAEELIPGPRGYRVSVVDYDATTDTLYKPAELPVVAHGSDEESYFLNDPRFHAQNVYAIVMRILARFEFALGRRVAWGSDGHQLHVAPHAFAEANAFYSREDRGLFFGYFTVSRPDGPDKPVFTCLSHDIIAHETTHAILDGLRRRYLEPSSPDQAAFHEGFADIVALLSMFSLQDVVGALLGSGPASPLISQQDLERDKIRQSVLFGLANQMGSELSRVRGQALRRSLELTPGKAHLDMPEFQEPHRRGEILVAAVMSSFLDIWLARLERLGFLEGRAKDRSLVVEEGARVAEHLLTMAIRAIDYSPPTDINFSDFLSALLTVDKEVVPDDTKYGYRGTLIRNFKAYGIEPARQANDDGTWRPCEGTFTYARTRYDSLLRDKEEVFRFIWENREQLKIDDDGYVEVEAIHPSIRIGPDGFVLRETIAQYVQIMTLTVGELKAELGIDPPADMPEDRRVRIFGGGALIFDDYGQLKYQIRNRLESKERQDARLKYLWENGFFDRPADDRAPFAALHLARATG